AGLRCRGLRSRGPAGSGVIDGGGLAIARTALASGGGRPLRIGLSFALPFDRADAVPDCLCRAGEGGALAECRSLRWRLPHRRGALLLPERDSDPQPALLGYLERDPAFHTDLSAADFLRDDGRAVPHRVRACASRRDGGEDPAISDGGV